MSTGPQPPAPAPQSAHDAGPHAEPDDREEIYFEGSPPVRAMAGTVCLYCLVALALLGIATLLIHKNLGPWWVWVALILAAIICPCIPWLLSKRVRYRITNYRIDFERGLLTKNIDTMELWHVEDLHFHQSILNRIFNVGAITVLCKDETMPQLQLHGIPNPRPIYEMLKQRVIAVKRQRGVIKMDPG
jgi:membrane protein YdbS with pleckstrin-like domain